jgi:hypothetical protein
MIEFFDFLPTRPGSIRRSHVLAVARHFTCWITSPNLVSRGSGSEIIGDENKQDSGFISQSCR